jgi:hypothetical protein
MAPIKIVHDKATWAEVARQLGPGSNWHEPDQLGLTARFDGTDGDLDNAGHWPMDVSLAETDRGPLGYDRDEHGRPRRGEMAIVISYDAWEHGKKYRGPDVAAVNVADLLGWAAQEEDAEVAQLAAEVARLEARIEQLKDANDALRRSLTNSRARPWVEDRQGT